MVKNKAYYLIIIIFAALLLINPQLCRQATVRGILLCGNVIIPSLFPFTACVLFIMKSGVLNTSKGFSALLQKHFGISIYEIVVFLLSIIGGYPVGAKLLNQAVENKAINDKRARKMLYYCVNAGPAFIISAVGEGMLRSHDIGIMLLAAHLIATFFMGIIFYFFSKKEDAQAPVIKDCSLSFADNFVLSVTEAADSVMSISVFVVLFSIFNSYIDYLSQFFKPLGYLSFITEITNAVSRVKNIYLISFLLGFGGLCVLCQILTTVKEFKINIGLFLLYRSVHGVLSSIFLFLLIRIFKVSYFVLGYQGQIVADVYTVPKVATAAFATVIIFILSVFGKKYDCKISENML